MCVLHGEGGDIELGSGSIFLSLPLFMSFVMIFIHLRMSDRPFNNNKYKKEAVKAMAKPKRIYDHNGMV